MEDQSRFHGSLVAFEGPTDTVSTQLRLLPTSSQILILPNLQHYIKRDNNARFNTRAFIKDVHQAALARHEVAAQFLQESSTTNKRLVFLNGGTAGAVSQCISAIAEHQGSGDALRAESTFRETVREGVKGLDHEEKYLDEKTLKTLEALGGEQMSRFPIWEIDEDENPISRAMRQADALYQETESLQPIDRHARTRPRSMSSFMTGYSDGLGEASPFFIVDSPPNEESQLNRRTDEEPTSKATGKEDFTHMRSLNDRRCSPKIKLPLLNRPPSCAGEPYNTRSVENRSTVQLLSPTTEIFLLPPAAPESAVYGEARLVHLQASTSQKLSKKTRSLGDFELNQARHCGATLTEDPEQKPARSPYVPEAKSRHLSIVEDPYSSTNIPHLPQAKFVKAHTTMIRRSPIFAKRLPKPVREEYVHRGTDAAEFDYGMSDEAVQPVLPLIEDLVIHFTSETTDRVLDSVVQSFKDGSYPVSPFPAASASSHTAGTNSYPSTPRTAELFDLENEVGMSLMAGNPRTEDLGEYGLYAGHGNDVRTSSLGLQRPSPLPVSMPIEALQLPTPAQTPPPTMSAVTEMDSKFHSLSTCGRPNAVAIQNSLRSILEVYFPSRQDGEYHHFSLPLLPDMKSLWGPIFGDPEADSRKSGEKTTDLILAIGCERGVKRDFLSALMGQTEKLGIKSNGVSRSGRLDLRYLIAKAMQSFTAQPLAHQKHNNPSDDPYILACLIIPHLETYLAANSSIRFLLLEYPAEHLATVLALQRLVGIEILKVAGIIDLDSEGISPTTSEVSSPVSSMSSKHSSLSGRYSINADENSLDAVTLPGSPFRNERPTMAYRGELPSFSKANYLLTCSATESEIVVFISTIWELLIEIDPFYMPECYPSNRPSTAKSTGDTTAGQPALSALFSRRAFLESPASPPMTPPLGLHVDDTDGGSGAGTPRVNASAAASLLAPEFPFARPRHPPPRDHSLGGASIRSRGRPDWLGSDAGSITTTSTTTTIRSSRRRSNGHMASQGTGSLSLARSVGARRLGAGAEAANGDDGASLYAVSVVGEGEFYDDEERRLMPMYMRQSELREGDSQKALKWLGLV